MYENEDHQFFDTLYQQWAQTTEAKTSYWRPEEDTTYYVGGPGTWNIWAVDVNSEGQEKICVAGHFDNEADADFICGLHGAIPDLIRRLHEAVDEAERLDEARDSQESLYADEVLANQELTQENDALRQQLAEAEAELRELEWMREGLEK